MDELFLGIDIGGTKTGVVLGTASGNILLKEQFSTEGAPDTIIERIISISERLALRFPDCKVLSAGISCGGPLDSVRGVILSPPHLPLWNGIPIVREIETRLGIPTFLQNDANACALAEWNWGNGKGCRNMIFLTFGTGFGAGLILNGALYEGTNGMAGEIGHVRLTSSGPFCYGKQGSVESFCSGEGISLLYEQAYASRLTAKDICKQANEGDAAASKIIDLSAEKLGLTLSILIDILDPEKIIIGSIYTRDEQLFRNKVLDVVNRETLMRTKTCAIMPSALGDDIGYMAALGVAKSYWKGYNHE